MTIDLKRMTIAVLAALVLTIPSLAQGPSRPTGAPSAAQRTESKAPRKKSRNAGADAKKRGDALRAIMAKLHVEQGATVADIGAGNGRDSWVFAGVVGPEGRVYSEEIEKGKVDTLKKEADRRELKCVEPILGRGDDPCLPAASVDMAFMHYVYHHVSQPRPMLQGLWKSLKPGGYLVIVDRHLGTLQDWVPREARATKHYWLAETTVVREAREEGFAVYCCAEECWPADDQFVLVFQRPEQGDEPAGDPDAPQPLDLDAAARALLPAGQALERPVIIALGESRKLVAPILERSSGQGLEIVLEEWATQKEERPPLPAGVTLPSVLTEKGDVSLGDQPVDALFFLDTYHLLFHQQALLARIHEQLAPGARVYILDRSAEPGLSRRESSHRRKIARDMVKQEMTAAGFELQPERPAPAEDRFLLVFAKASTN